jgi:hypothetical protein
MTESHSFPKPILTKVEGEPTNTSYQKLLVEVYANAMSVLSNRGGGKKGHLGAIMSPEAYQELAPGATPWEAPPNPGPTPPVLTEPTAAQITENTQLFNVAVKVFETYSATISAIREQIVEAIEDDFICELFDERLGYSLVAPLALLTHIHTIYGSITPEEITINDAGMDTEWDTSSTTIELLFKKVKSIRRFAERGGDPITEVTTVRRMLAVVEKTGQFELSIEKWRAKTTDTPDYGTWAQFKIDFKKSDTERKRKITAQTGGYAGANITTTRTPPVHSANHTATTTSRSNVEENLRLQIRAEAAEETLQAFMTGTGSCNNHSDAGGGRRATTSNQSNGSNSDE